VRKRSRDGSGANDIYLGGTDFNINDHIDGDINIDGHNNISDEASKAEPRPRSDQTGGCWTLIF
jgi:hypothetical protein